MYACSIVGKLWQCPGWDFFEAHTHSHRHTCICLYMSPICSWELSRPATAQSNWSVVPLAFWSVTISTASKVSAGNSEGQVPSKLCQQEYVLFSNLLKKKKEWNTQTHIYFIIPILKICASRHIFSQRMIRQWQKQLESQKLPTKTEGDRHVLLFTVWTINFF